MNWQKLFSVKLLVLVLCFALAGIAVAYKFATFDQIVDFLKWVVSTYFVTNVASKFSRKV